MAVLCMAVTVAFKGDKFVGRYKVQPSVVLSVLAKSLCDSFDMPLL